MRSRRGLVFFDVLVALVIFACGIASSFAALGVAGRLVGEARRQILVAIEIANRPARELSP